MMMYSFLATQINTQYRRADLEPLIIQCLAYLVVPLLRRLLRPVYRLLQQTLLFRASVIFKDVGLVHAYLIFHFAEEERCINIKFLCLQVFSCSDRRHCVY